MPGRASGASAFAYLYANGRQATEFLDGQLRQIALNAETAFPPQTRLRRRIKIPKISSPSAYGTRRASS